MSNVANPALVAALQAVKQFVNTVLTGDPATIGLRVQPALTIMIGQVELQFPVLVTAEVGAVQADINAKLDGMITKLQA